MKLLHTSDWHIGRIFYNVSLLEDQRYALAHLIEIIKEHAVDGVIIAGDIYDRAVPPATAVKVLDDWLYTVVSQMKIPVFMISGNHDSAQRLSFGSRQLKASGLTIVGDFDEMLTPMVLTKGEVSVQISGIPYSDPEHVRDHYQCEVRDYDHAHQLLTEKVKQSQHADMPSIVVSHCFIDGAQESESERTLSVGGADRVSYKHFEPFNYVALGHLHQPQHKGHQYIRYSGSLLKYSFSEEAHTKGATIVSFDKNGVTDIEPIAISAKRDMRSVEGSFDEIITKGATDPKPDDYILARITDTAAILDPMAKIRQVYPNALHLERSTPSTNASDAIDRELFKRNELDVFADFFKRMRGKPMSEQQAEALGEVVDSVRRGE